MNMQAAILVLIGGAVGYMATCHLMKGKPVV